MRDQAEIQAQIQHLWIQVQNVRPLWQEKSTAILFRELQDFVGKSQGSL